MKKKNILVYPAGTEIGLEIARSLQFSKHFNIIGANSINDHSDIIFDTVIHGFPSVYEKEELLKEITKVIELYLIDIIYPAHDEVLAFFASLNFSGVKIITPSVKTSEVLRYKSKTYKALTDAHFVPNIIQKNNKNNAKFPLFARPDRGQGAVDAFRIDTLQQLAECLASQTKYIVTEFLPGCEYTVDCYSNNKGQLQYLCARERQRIRNGICVRVHECLPDEFQEIALSISSKINLTGCWFFQVKRDQTGTLKLMEVANRVAGTMGYERLKGVNLVQATLWEALGYTVILPQNQKGNFIYDRSLYEGVKFPYALNALYVDLDDTLIFDDGSVNYELIGYIIGLRFNQKTKIILITRHKSNPLQALEKYSLEAYFDEIIHLQKNECKSLFIKGEKNAFIDDSFIERMQVAAQHPKVLCVGPEGQRVLSGFL